MDEKKFSIILPTFNRCYIIWRAIQSVIKQTYPFWELLIIDDGSTDNTDKLVKQFTDPRIKYFKKKKQEGPSPARNFGLTKASGDYIAYLDSDNRWSDDFLEVMRKTFKKYPNKVLLFCKKNYRLKIINDQGQEEYLRNEWYKYKKYFDLKRLWQRKIVIDTNAMCHKRSIIKKVGRWNDKINFWEDWEFTLRTSLKYPHGLMYLNRSLLDYEQVIDWRKKKQIIKTWDQAERYIYSKYKDYPLMKDQNWYPPTYGNRSTIGVIDFLRSKKGNL